jgi:CDP-glucose 4,6-dehydratase
MSLSDFSQLRGLNGPVLITGHTGFKGTWLTYLLSALDIPSFGASLLPEPDSMFARLERTGKIPEKFIDIRNRQEVSELIQKIKPSVIIHMAAQPIVLESYKKPVETFDTNVMGTAHVLDAAFIANSVQVIGVVTTDKVYSNDNSGIPFSENSPLGGKDPYSASKVGTEQVINAWRAIASSTGGPAVVSLRGGNVIGGGDFAENRLLPDFVRSLISGNEIRIRNPLSTRPWQHVLDPLYGYLLALEESMSLRQNTTYNFSPEGSSLSVQEVAIIAKSQNPKINFRFDPNPNEQIMESISLSLNSDKSHQQLGWFPKWTQENAVTSTIQWWEQLLQGKEMAQKTIEHEINLRLER